MRPRFRKGDLAVYDSGDSSFPIVRITKVSYDIDEKEYEYYDYFDDASYYGYHLLTLNQGLTEAKRLKAEIKRQIEELKNKENDTSDTINRIEEFIKYKIQKKEKELEK